MTSRRLCYLYLTCDELQSREIARVLLEERLIACAKFVPVQAIYWWQDDIENADEIMLVMESALDLFDEVEAKLEEVHSYDTFVLEAVPVDRLSQDAGDWMRGELKPASRVV